MKKLNIIFPGWALTYNFYAQFITGLHGETLFIDFNFFKKSEFPSNTCKILNYEEFIQNLPSDSNITVISHSMGTLYALDYVTQTDNINKFVIISGFSKFTADKKRKIPGQPAMIVKIMRNRFKKNPEATLKDFYKAALSPTNNIHIPLPASKNINAENLLKGLDFLISADKTFLIKSIKLPVSVIHATHDKIVPFKTAEFLQRSFPQATLFQINKGGHLLPFSHPHLSKHYLY